MMHVTQNVNYLSHRRPTDHLRPAQRPPPRSRFGYIMCHIAFREAAPCPSWRSPAEHDWAAFTQVGQMNNHWDRPGWNDDRRVYYWMLTFAADGPLVDRARACQRAVAGLGMDAVPEDGLHVTMTRIGDVAQVSAVELDRLERLIVQAGPRGFEMAAHPLTGSAGALRFSLTPWTPLLLLHETLTDANRKAGLSGGKPTAAFRPHLAIAYNDRDRDVAPVVDVVAELRRLPAVAVEVTTVELVELRRDSRSYRWRVLYRIPLQR